jgi:hypothetical protein
MFILLVLHPALRRAYDYACSLQKSSPSPAAKSTTAGMPRTRLPHTDARIDQRVNFDIVFGVLYLIVLHGFSSTKALVILYINFILATRLPRKYVPAATWVFNIGVLFANEFCRGYPFAMIADYVLPWFGSSETASEKATRIDWAKMLDNYGGLVPRWEILFKFAILRMISFNFDYCWGSNRAGDSPLEVCSLEVIPIVSQVKLIAIRRSSSTPATFLRGIECQSRLAFKTTLSAITLHTYYMLRYTSQGPF